MQQKIELYRNCLSRAETDLHVNSTTLEQLKVHISQVASDVLRNYDTVDIAPRVTAIHPVPIDRSFDQGVTLEVGLQWNSTAATVPLNVHFFADTQPKATSSSGGHRWNDTPPGDYHDSHCVTLQTKI